MLSICHLQCTFYLDIRIQTHLSYFLQFICYQPCTFSFQIRIQVNSSHVLISTWRVQFTFFRQILVQAILVLSCYLCATRCTPFPCKLALTPLELFLAFEHESRLDCCPISKCSMENCCPILKHYNSLGATQ